MRNNWIIVLLWLWFLWVRTIYKEKEFWFWGKSIFELLQWILNQGILPYHTIMPIKIWKGDGRFFLNEVCQISCYFSILMGWCYCLFLMNIFNNILVEIFLQTNLYNNTEELELEGLIWFVFVSIYLYIEHFFGSTYILKWNTWYTGNS